MFDLDPDIAQKRYASGPVQLAKLFRELSLDVQSDRDVILKHLDHPEFRRIYDDDNSTCLERTVTYETLSYGDPGVLLSCPGPSLSGLIIREIGSEDQKKLFFSYVAAHRARTFMAVTEPQKGSDAGNMQTCLNEQGRIHGEKWFVGNGRDGEIGTLILKTGAGPFDIGVVMLTPEVLSDRRIQRRHLPVAGMKGAGLTHFRFDGVPVDRTNLLGLDKRPIQRGMLALIRTFYRMRPAVTAMALGSAQAMLDIIHLNRGSISGSAQQQHAMLQNRADSIRRLNIRAARKIDRGEMDGAAVSIAKASATELAEDLARLMPHILGIRQYCRNPWLMKTFMDVHGYEWMEGSKDIQRLNAFQSI